MASIRTCKWCGKRHNIAYSFSSSGSTEYCSKRCRIQGEKGNRMASKEGERIVIRIFALSAILAGIGFLLWLAFAPGIVITSLFTNLLDNAFVGWLLSIVFSAVIFFLIYFTLNKYSKIDNIHKTKIWKLGKYTKLQIYSTITYIVISILSIYMLLYTDSASIVQICTLLQFWK